eukprot:2084336-Prorocentrum_lima.AAC.1
MNVGHEISVFEGSDLVLDGVNQEAYHINHVPPDLHGGCGCLTQCWSLLSGCDHLADFSWGWVEV